MRRAGLGVPLAPPDRGKEDGKIYRVDGYGHRAEAGYLQMKEDGKTVKEVDGYGHEKPGKLVVKEDGKVYR